MALPLGWLALLVAMIAVCWNLNAWRLRVMLNGRAPGLGHGAALATVVGVLVEVPLMLALVRIANNTRDKFPA